MAHSSGLVITWITGPNFISCLRKSAAEVALNLQNHVFTILGIPRILHSDNGWEFVNDIALVKEWPGQITIC